MTRRGILPPITHEGLTIPSYALSEYTCSAFAVLDFIFHKINNSDLPIQVAAKKAVCHMLVEFEPYTCCDHESSGNIFANKMIVNIYCNNARKISSDSVVKDRVKGCFLH